MNKAELMKLLHYIPADATKIIIGGSGNRRQGEDGDRIAFDTKQGGPFEGFQTARGQFRQEFIRFMSVKRFP